MAMQTRTFWIIAGIFFLLSCSSSNSRRGSSTGSEATDATDGIEITDASDGQVDSSDGASTESDSTDTVDGADETEAVDATTQTDATDSEDATDLSDATDAQDTADATDAEDTTDAMDITDGADAMDATDLSDAVDVTDGADAMDAVDGVDAADGPSEPVACGGSSGVECTSGFYCMYSATDECGVTGATGVCNAIPEVCPDIDEPVCGCDGVTYSNKCDASQAGFSVAAPGSCDGPEPSLLCGGTEGLLCGPGEFCLYGPDAECGFDNMVGKCVPKPEVCSDIFAPVCGCDGTIYGNECEAHAAGTSVASMDFCEGPPPIGECGGMGALSCSEDQFCSYPDDDACGASGSFGLCEPVPLFCPTIFLPVCGCDGNQYSNKCMANSVGVSVSDDESCLDDDPPTPPAICGGFAGFICDAGSYCSYPLAANCGFGDATGLCKPKPLLCAPTQGPPVCGCDGDFYSSACEAALAGVSVAPDDQCSF